jgi:hypothetical protein
MGMHLVPTFWSDAPERSLFHQHTKTGETVALLHGQNFLTCWISVPNLKLGKKCRYKVTLRWVWTFTSWFVHWVCNCPNYNKSMYLPWKEIMFQTLHVLFTHLILYIVPTFKEWKQIIEKWNTATLESTL